MTDRSLDFYPPSMAEQRGRVPTQQPAERPSTAADSEKYDSSAANTHREAATQPDTVSDKDREFYEKYGTYDRYEITEEDCYDELGFCFPTWKKVADCLRCPDIYFPINKLSVAYFEYCIYRTSFHELQHLAVFERSRRYFGRVRRQRPGRKTRSCHLLDHVCFRLRAVGGT